MQSRLEVTESLSEKIFLGSNVGELETGDVPANITRVNLSVDSDHYYTAGDDTGRAIEVTCPWGSQEMANSILASVRGKTYQPYTATDALLDPAAEIGDAVTVGGYYSVIADIFTSFDRASAPTISAPGSDEIDDEYPYESRERRETNRQIAQTRSIISKTSEEIRLLVEDEINEISTSFSVQIGEISARVDDAEGSIEVVVNTIDGLTVTDSSGTTKIKGSSIETESLKVSSANITGTLTIGQLPSTVAEKGDIPKNTSDLFNDSGYQTATGVTTIVNGTVTTDYVNALGISVNAANVYGTLKAGSINLNGLMAVMVGGSIYGYLGGSNAGQYIGSVLCDPSQSNYVIATGGGARLQYGTTHQIFVASAGCFSSSEMQVWSDKELKNSISYDMSIYEPLFFKLKPSNYFLNHEKEAGKRHMGLIANDVRDTAKELGIPEKELAMLGVGEDMLSIAYGELTVLNTYIIQKLAKRIEELEALL